MMRWITRLLALSIIVVLLVGAYFYSFINSPLAIAAHPQQLTIAKGSSIRSIAAELQQDGILPDTWRFILLAKLTDKASQLKAGVYVLDQDITPTALLDKFVRGETSLTVVRWIEGWTLHQAFKEMQQNDEIKQEVKNESDLVTLLALPTGTKLEGMIFPDTYQVAKGSSNATIFKLAYQKMEKVLNEEWAQRAPELPLKTPYEALVLSSIIEKETGAAKDRAMISAVFNNRLKIGMRLQTDPSVIYGLGEKFDGNLTKKHLQTDTPYNSYTREGLPPTPISLPSRASIHAALHPAESKVLYFVAKGDGSSIFSDTLAAHNAAVAKYQR